MMHLMYLGRIGRSAQDAGQSIEALDRNVAYRKAHNPEIVLDTTEKAPSSYETS